MTEDVKSGFAFDLTKVLAAVAPLFAAPLSAEQRDAIGWLVTEWNARGLDDPRWFAVILATVQYQTGSAMAPCDERGQGAGKPQGEPSAETGETYFGRGLTHFRFWENFAELSRHVGVNLAREPELAKDPNVARRLLFDGMIKGFLCGKHEICRLEDYLNPTTEDWVGAAGTVETNDAAKVAAKAQKYFLAIGEGCKAAPKPKAVPFVFPGEVDAGPLVPAEVNPGQP